MTEDFLEIQAILVGNQYLSISQTTAMMKPFLFLFWMLIISATDAQTVQNNNITGKADGIFSKSLHEKRDVWVYLPLGYDDLLLVSKRYPVVYLLTQYRPFIQTTQ